MHADRRHVRQRGGRFVAPIRPLTQDHGKIGERAKLSTAFVVRDAQILERERDAEAGKEEALYYKIIYI